MKVSKKATDKHTQTLVGPKNTINDVAEHCLNSDLSHSSTLWQKVCALMQWEEGNTFLNKSLN